MIVLSWSNESYIQDHAELDDFVYESSGDVFIVDDDSDSRERVGKFRAYVVDVGRTIDESEHVYDVLSAHSSHLEEYYEPIFGNEAPEFANQVMELFDDSIFGNNLLIIDRLEILPQYRGKCFGLVILRHMIVRFSSGVGLVAIKPFPLQFESGGSSEKEQKWRDLLLLNRLPKNEDVATKNLYQYYSKLGFTGLHGTSMMVLSTARRLPTIEMSYEPI